jgi:hypothetical protein
MVKPLVIEIPKSDSNVETDQLFHTPKKIPESIQTDEITNDVIKYESPLFSLKATPEHNVFENLEENVQKKR